MAFLIHFVPLSPTFDKYGFDSDPLSRKNANFSVLKTDSYVGLAQGDPALGDDQK
jgi:hypothetical protein